MLLLIKLFVGVIGLLHLFIMYLEMSGDYQKQSSTFGMPLDFVKEPNAQVALKNMGIYNGALGLLILSSLLLFSGTPLIKLLFLLMLFVLIVGGFGGKTVTKSIYLIQALPAVLALLLLLTQL